MWDLMSQQCVGLKIRQGEESARLKQELRRMISIKRAPGWQSPLYNMKIISATECVEDLKIAFLLQPSDVYRCYHNTAITMNATST